MNNLLRELRDQQVYLSLEGDKLKLRFDQPKLSEDLLAKIKLHKQALIDYLKENQSSASAFEQIDALPPSEEGYILSSSQRRMWVLSQFEDASLAYNLPNRVDLNGDYNIQNFKQAIDSVVRRHEILRSVFKENEEGQVRQWLIHEDEFRLEMDYRDLRTEPQQEQKVKEYIRKDNTEAFDLEHGPLLRISLLQTEDHQYVFYYNMHHIISDGWSMDLLAQEVLAYYEHYQNGAALSLPDLRIHYKDYAAWQQQQLESQVNQTQQTYWLEQLSGDLRVLDLPSQKNRPKIKTYNGLTLRTFLNEEDTQLISDFGQQQGGSLFITLLSLWNVLFHRYTGQKDIIIGTPVAGREHSDLERQIGFYVNTIALRNQINPASTFLDFYHQTKASTLEAYDHQGYPFDLLVEELDLKRDTSRSAIFDVMLILQNIGAAIEEYQIPESQIEQIEVSENSYAKFDLELVFQKLGPYLSIRLDFNTDVYEQEMIEGLLLHYKSLLRIALTTPETRIQELDYLSEEEKNVVLYEFNQTETDYPKDKTIIDLFQEQVRNNPQEIALVFKDKDWTYQQLDRLSDGFAHILHTKHGVETGDLIGLMLPRTDSMIIAMLGILKSGAAYVPIDPAYPQARKEYIQEDANCKLIIDEAWVAAMNQNGTYQQDHMRAGHFRASDLAYVIYTSGSTGKPKGVMIEHRSVVAFLNNIDHQFGYEEAMIVAATTNITFDISVLEIFGTLCLGKQLVLFDEECLLDPTAFISELEDQGVEMLQLTPSRLQQLGELFLNAHLPMLRNLIVGGEPFPKNWYHLLKTNPVLHTINVYGPTEATIWSSFLDVRSSTELSIGAPLENEQIYILNDHQEPQPVGVIGEICIGGAGLARGYLNRRQLTQEKFIENPFRKGERIYKTGDLGFWLPDGNISCVGRVDDQVKIRGYRIELGEIEVQLQKIEEVQKAVVLAKHAKPGDTDLVAYLLTKVDLDIRELRRHLSTYLPEYMIPQYFVRLDTLPLLPSGKVDKSALPNPEGLALSSGQEYQAPRNEIEEQIIQILTEELRKGKDEVGIHDNFFDLGATSIKLISILGKINRQFKVAIRPISLFQYPNVGELVENVFYESVVEQAEDETNYQEEFSDIMDIMED